MKKYLILIFVLAQITELISAADEHVKIHVFNLCQTAKHCIKCRQLDIGFGRYYNVPNQEIYLRTLIDKFNNFRSWYAKEFEIGNMRFAKWNFEFYSLAEDTATMVGNAEISCAMENNSSRTLQPAHNLVDFSTSVKSVLYVNSTNHEIFKNQFNNLSNLTIHSTYLLKYNVNEFGCSYSFRPLLNRTTFLLRCIFYVDNDIGTGEILSAVQCSNCTEAESCIGAKYPGLCVPSNSTERYVQKLLNPEPVLSYAGASMALYIKLYLFITTILVILCEILLINKI